MTQEEFLKRIKDANGDTYTVLSPFTGWKDKVQVQCNKCGEQRGVRTDALLKGRGCPECLKKVYSKEYLKTTEAYAKEVKEKGLGDYELVSEYTGVSNPIEVKHLKCDEIFPTTPFQFNRGRRCPHCKLSKGETFVEHVLEDMGMSFQREVTNKVLPNLPHRFSFDFYIPSKGILIEYQGVQHYKPVDIFGGEDNLLRQQKNDEVKRAFAKDNGYRLLEIPYTISTLEDIRSAIKEFVNK